MRTQRTALIVVLLVVGFAAPARAQDSLARARDFYASAAYEEALAELATLKNVETAGVATEVASYQLFCLVALGRHQEARGAVEAIVRADPQYRPSATHASPRVRDFFEEVRRPLMPAIVKELYSRAKSAFDRKEMATAVSEFDRVIALIDEDETAPASIESADIRTLAAGFRDLGRMAVAAAAAAAAAAAPPPPPPSAPEPVPAAEPAPIRVYGPEDTDVVAPVARSRSMPPWSTANGAGRQRFVGTLAIEVGEDGTVLSATLPRPVHALYNTALLRAAKTWTFTPATKAGVPVRYRMLTEIVLNP